MSLQQQQHMWCDSIVMAEVLSLVHAFDCGKANSEEFKIREKALPDEGRKQLQHFLNAKTRQEQQQAMQPQM